MKNQYKNPIEIKTEYMNLNYEDPLVLKNSNRYERLSDEDKNRWDTINSKNNELLVIKKMKKVDIQEGDIFVLSIRENLYFYGRVLKTDIKVNRDSWYNGKQTIVIFQCKSREISLDSFILDYENLLVNPSIVDKSNWQKGYFYTIGNIPISQKDKKVDYGFFKSGIPGIKHGYFCTEEGVKLGHFPKFYSRYAILTTGGIASQIEKEIIVNPLLLK